MESEYDYPKKLLELGDKDGAIIELSKILRQNHQDTDAWFLLADAVDEPGKKADCYRQILRHKPDDKIASEKLRVILGVSDSKNQSVDGKISNESQATTKSNKKPSPLLLPFLISAFVLMVCGICFTVYILGDSSSSQPRGFMGIGDKGILYNDGGDVSLALSKEVLDKVIRMSTSGDTLGYAQLVDAGLVFYVNSGTGVLVIDSTMTAKQVRILEGKYIGTSGWVPSEWVRAK